MQLKLAQALEQRNSQKTLSPIKTSKANLINTSLKSVIIKLLEEGTDVLSM